MLNFSQLSKRYRRGEQVVNALQQASGVIAQGEMLALCGPSGSGKSTLLNLLGLLDMDYQGEIHLNRQPYPKNPLEAAKLRRSKMGFVFQKFNLVPVMTALENVTYPLLLNGYPQRQQQQLAQEILSKVGLADFIGHRPDHLSGGQQQRVAIARAMVHQPSLVIADEPTASLDSKTADTVIALMKRLGQDHGTTFIIATHDQRMADHCDRQLSLHDGELVKELNA